MSTKPTASTDVFTVPNVISGVRLLVSAAVFVLLAWQWWGWGLAAFVLAASSTPQCEHQVAHSTSSRALAPSGEEFGWGAGLR